MAKQRKVPVKQGKVGYCNPPLETRFKPGESGNPAGRPTAGTTIIEWVNVLAEQGLTESQLRRVARDCKLPWPKRTAAERIIRTLEAPDLADMEPLLKGEVGLAGLRANGVNTEAIKKYKVRTRVIRQEGVDVGEEIDREIELYDRAGDDFDRIVDRTAGKPVQPQQHTGPNGGPIEHAHVNHIIADPEATRLANALARRMAGHARGDGESAN